MSKVSDYTRRINSFGDKLEKMLVADFPNRPEVIDKISGHIAAIQVAVLNEFMEKGGKG